MNLPVTSVPPLAHSGDRCRARRQRLEAVAAVQKPSGVLAEERGRKTSGAGRSEAGCNARHNPSSGSAARSPAAAAHSRSAAPWSSTQRAATSTQRLHTATAMSTGTPSINQCKLPTNLFRPTTGTESPPRLWERGRVRQVRRTSRGPRPCQLFPSRQGRPGQAYRAKRPPPPD